MENLRECANSSPLTVYQMKYEEQPTKKKASFMVDDLVRNQFDISLLTIGSSKAVDSKSWNNLQSRNAVENQDKQDDMMEASVQCRSTKPRSSFSVEQVFHLERVFERQKYIGSRDRLRLAEQLQMTETQVKTWFQNRRMKMKKKQTECFERRAKLSYLNNLAHNMQRSYHGYQSYYSPVYPPPGTPRPLCTGLSQPDYTWSQQAALNFPPNQLARFPPPSWDASAYDHMQINISPLEGPTEFSNFT